MEIEIWIDQQGLAEREVSAMAHSAHGGRAILVLDPDRSELGVRWAAGLGIEPMDRAAAFGRLAGASDADAILVLRDGMLTEGAADTVAAALVRFPELALVYGDSSRPSGVVRRPDSSPIRLRSQDFLGPVVVFRADALRQQGGFRLDAGDAWVYDAALGLSEAGASQAVLPSVLAHEVPRRGDAGRLAAEAAVVHRRLRDAGIEAEIVGTAPTGRRLRYPLSSPPLVSVVIPTRGSSARIAGSDRVLVVEAVRGILERSSYPRLEFVVVADSVTPPAVLDELRAIAADRLRIVDWDRPFNFSAKVNEGVVASRGEYLLILNDDVDPVSEDWIETMVGLAEQRGVGVVGATLYFEDSTIQHAGHLYTGGLPGHVGFTRPGGFDDALGSFSVDREVSGVTGACLLASASVVHEVGGFSPRLPGNYNDVDFCLKVRASGRSVVVSPHARLYHFESKTRDPRVGPEELDLLQQRWSRRIEVEMYSRLPS